MATSQTVTARDGVELAVHDLGGTGPVLLLGHATGYCGITWEPVAHELRETFHCIAPDCRAHGASGTPGADGLSWRLLGADVLSVIDALDEPSPLFGAGHSAGATGLLLAEAERPGTFAGIWCFEPVLFPGRSDDTDVESNPMAAAARRRRSRFSDRAEAKLHYERREPFSRFAGPCLTAFLDCGLVGDESGEGLRLACRPENEARFYEMTGFEDTWAAVESIDCPVTFATGDQPGSFGAGHAGLLAGRLTYGQAEVLAALSHFGPLEGPTAAAASICDSLGSG
ncbi:MAG: alpha/beta hydrolase [Actinobacteria bacterium]|nr:alpha/beta hydrolase [Actinomycetota bacterium]